jgi:hypothetical protein
MVLIYELCNCVIKDYLEIHQVVESYLDGWILPSCLGLALVVALVLG